MTARPAVGRLRGKTRAGRLRLWNALMVQLWPESIAQGVLEVGIGERVDTLVELAEALGAWPTAIEVHPGRVARARAAVPAPILEADALQPPQHHLRYGLVRCANVLRQYPDGEVPAAHGALVAHLQEGGVVLEGTCDAGGDVGSFHVLGRGDDGVERRALVFFSSFSRGFAPIQLRDWLPRDLRREVRAGGVMADFFARWTAVWREVRGGVPAEDFRRTVAALGATCALVDLSHVEDGAAAMVWGPEGGVPRPV
jgi:hypothetical protein